MEFRRICVNPQISNDEYTSTLWKPGIDLSQKIQTISREIWFHACHVSGANRFSCGIPKLVLNRSGWGWTSEVGNCSRNTNIVEWILGSSSLWHIFEITCTFTDYPIRRIFNIQRRLSVDAMLTDIKFISSWFSISSVAYVETMSWTAEIAFAAKKFSPGFHMHVIGHKPRFMWNK
jgi:hypothetical protein